MKASIYCGLFVLGCSATLNAQQHQLYRTRDMENKASLAHRLAEDIYEIEGQLSLETTKNTVSDYQVLEAGDTCSADAMQDLVVVKLHLDGKGSAITKQETLSLQMPKAMLENAHDGKITFYIKKEDEDKIEVTAMVPDNS